MPKCYFPVRGGFDRRIGEIRALDDISFDVRDGEIVFENRNVAGQSPKQAKAQRSRLQYAYQDPGESLDPRWRISKSLEEPLIIHTDLPKARRMERVREILAAVGLPAAHIDLFPHEISGGQQRRVGLARILMLNPKVIILDEPTAGLDVSA